ncbi:hypothetical protein D3C86_1772780 [compost metagenome]
MAFPCADQEQVNFIRCLIRLDWTCPISLPERYKLTGFSWGNFGYAKPYCQSIELK